MTEYAYDPEFPYIVESRKTGRYVARFADPMKAMHYASDNEGLWVIDTTPRPKIPEDARFIYWTDEDGYPGFAERGDDEWLLPDGSLYSTADLLEDVIGDYEITVLVPKEDS